MILRSLIALALSFAFGTPVESTAQQLQQARMLGQATATAVGMRSFPRHPYTPDPATGGTSCIICKSHLAAAFLAARATTAAATPEELRSWLGRSEVRAWLLNAIAEGVFKLVREEDLLEEINTTRERYTALRKANTQTLDVLVVRLNGFSTGARYTVLDEYGVLYAGSDQKEIVAAINQRMDKAGKSKDAGVYILPYGLNSHDRDALVSGLRTQVRASASPSRSVNVFSGVTADIRDQFFLKNPEIRIETVSDISTVNETSGKLAGIYKRKYLKWFKGSVGFTVLDTGFRGQIHAVSKASGKVSRFLDQFRPKQRFKNRSLASVVAQAKRAVGPDDPDVDAFETFLEELRDIHLVEFMEPVRTPGRADAFSGQAPNETAGRPGRRHSFGE